MKEQLIGVTCTTPKIQFSQVDGFLYQLEERVQFAILTRSVFAKVYLHSKSHYLGGDPKCGRGYPEKSKFHDDR